MVFKRPLDIFLLIAILAYLIFLPIYASDVQPNGRSYAFSKEGKVLLSTSYVHAVFDVKLQPLRDQIYHTKVMFLKIKQKWQEAPTDPKLKTLYMLAKEEYEMLENKFYEIERWLTQGTATNHTSRQKRFLGSYFSTLTTIIIPICNSILHIIMLMLQVLFWPLLLGHFLLIPYLG